MVAPNVPIGLPENGFDDVSQRCRTRTAKLSLGFCDSGRIVCAYHGWQYDENGFVVRVPQSGAARESRTAMFTPASEYFMEALSAFENFRNNSRTTHVQLTYKSRTSHGHTYQTEAHG